VINAAGSFVDLLEHDRCAPAVVERDPVESPDAAELEEARLVDVGKQ